MSLSESARTSSPAATPTPDQSEHPPKKRPRRRDHVADERISAYGLVERAVLTRIYRELGPKCAAAYTLLCTYADYQGKNCFPLQDTLAEQLAVVRSTIFRATQRLIRAGFVGRTKHVNDRGKVTGNEYRIRRLADLPAETEGPGEQKRAAELQRDALQNCSATRCKTAAPREHTKEGDQEVCVCADEGAAAAAHTHTPDSSWKKEIGRLADLWMSRLICLQAKWRQNHKAEFRGFCADLLRYGFTADELEASILDENRPRDEWPREWKARLEKARKASRRSQPPDAEKIARQRRREEEEKRQRQAERETPEYKRVMDRLKGKIGDMP